MQKETEVLQEEIEKHLIEDINWLAIGNEVIKSANKSQAARDDIEQFASDSFSHGWQAAKKYFLINGF